MFEERREDCGLTVRLGIHSPHVLQNSFPIPARYRQLAESHCEGDNCVPAGGQEREIKQKKKGRKKEREREREKEQERLMLLLSLSGEL